MPGYIPPVLRNNNQYKPRNLSMKKKIEVIDYTKIKTQKEIFEELKNTNPGKADQAWND